MMEVRVLDGDSSYSGPCPLSTRKVIGGRCWVLGKARRPIPPTDNHDLNCFPDGGEIAARRSAPQGVGQKPRCLDDLGKIGRHTSELQSRPHLVCRLLLE